MSYLRQLAGKIWYHEATRLPRSDVVEWPSFNYGQVISLPEQFSQHAGSQLAHGVGMDGIRGRLLADGTVVSFARVVEQRAGYDNYLGLVSLYGAIKDIGSSPRVYSQRLTWNSPRFRWRSDSSQVINGFRVCLEQGLFDA